MPSLAHKSLATGYVTGAITAVGGAGVTWMNPYIAVSLMLGGGLLYVVAYVAIRDVEYLPSACSADKGAGTPSPGFPLWPASRPSRSTAPAEPMCECENPDRGLFVWRGDPEWASCVQCDARVRPLTDEERAERALGQKDPST